MVYCYFSLKQKLSITTIHLKSNIVQHYTINIYME